MKKLKPVAKGKGGADNRSILIMTYVFVAVFVGLLGYFTYFIIVQAPEVINNPYNKRQDLLSQRIIRGRILGNEGEVLAQTKTDGNGEEYRYYPYENVFCHVVGRFSNGKSGIESSQNFTLLTSSENPLTAVLKELKGEKNIGDDVVTTLDVELQKMAYSALGGYKGAVVVLEPSTGKVLAMVSKSDYNPNKAAEQWKTLSSSDDSPLLNRATQGLYPPGSTFKLVTALEYMREHPSAYKKYSYECKGSDTFSGVNINCYNKTVHGTEDLTKSFAKSCNDSFANIGTLLNLKSYRALCDTFLFNQALPVSPDITASKSSFVLNRRSDPSQVPQTAIGQGDTQITPLHNAMLAAAVANGGVVMKPYVVDHVESHNGSLVKQYRPEAYGNIMTEKEAKLLKRMMRAVVEEGTATSLNSSRYSAYGKTGSAEFDSNKSSHAWFIGFAGKGEKEIAVSVIAEGAGTGGTYAAPIAKKIFDAYFS